MSARSALRCSASRRRRELRDNCSFRRGSSSDVYQKEAVMRRATLRPTALVVGLAVVLASVGAARPAAAQSGQMTIDLVVATGRPLRVALDQRIQLKRVGQPVTGAVTEPVYAYDRIVIPVGTRVRGHIAQIDSGSTFVRARAYLAGNFSPAKHAVLQFDTLLLDDGHEIPIDTVVKGGIPNVTRKVAGGSSSASRAGPE